MKSQAMKFDVIGIGAVAVDDLIYVDEYPAADSKIRTLHRERQGGGQTGTALVAAARYGARCAYAGQLGRCELSRYVESIFDAEGIEHSFAPRTPEGVPAHSTIIVELKHDTRTILSTVSDDGLGPDDELPDVELLARCRVLLVDHHRTVATLRLVRAARRLGVPVVGDYERVVPGEEFEELVRLTDHLIVGEEFARTLTGSADASELLRDYWSESRQAIIVTRGQEGCIYRVGEDSSVIELPASQFGETQDTTGCGDVFHGVYAAALAEGMPVDECVRRAMIVAGIKATRLGGQAGIPRRKDVRF